MRWDRRVFEHKCRNLRFPPLSTLPSLLFINSQFQGKVMSKKILADIRKELRRSSHEQRKTNSIVITFMVFFGAATFLFTLVSLTGYESPLEILFIILVAFMFSIVVGFLEKKRSLN